MKSISINIRCCCIEKSAGQKVALTVKLPDPQTKKADNSRNDETILSLYIPFIIYLDIYYWQLHF